MNSANSENLENHMSIKVDQFKDPLCYLCLDGAVVSSLALTQESVGSSHHFFAEFSESYLGKTPKSFTSLHVR